MDKWFEDKFERERLRNYAKKRLRGNVFDEFFRKFSVTTWMIMINLAVFVILALALSIFGEEKIVSLFALQANSFFSGKFWIVFTSMFVHFELWHLLVNLASLFFIGKFAERIIGRKRFFWLYMISGILAGIFYAVLSYYFGIFAFGEKIFGNPEIFAVGASGAIFSLLGILAVLTPYTKVYLIAGPMFAIILKAVFSSMIPASSFLPIINLLVYIYFIFSIFSIFSFNPRIFRFSIPIKLPFWLLPIVAIVPLIIIGLFVSLPIGNMAHLGGLLAGLAYGFYLKNKYKKKAAMISRMYSR